MRMIIAIVIHRAYTAISFKKGFDLQDLRALLYIAIAAFYDK